MFHKYIFYRMPDQEMVENRDLVAIKDWLCRQPHLPHEVGKI